MFPFQIKFRLILLKRIFSFVNINKINLLSKEKSIYSTSKFSTANAFHR
ncbi:hypothetical protein WANG_p1102 (plasmid) [Lactobacillus kefiranofaciens subsp. kefiranofaciens]|nr:hypothetical protein WANG_p1102 [Lactobacillus kefiranofaciens subsp. kefiranofaciens]